MLKLAQHEELDRAFVQSVVVYACCQVRARAFASIPLELRRGEREVENTPLNALLAKPNPLMSGRKFWKAWETYFCLAGGVFVFFNKNNGGTMSCIEPNQMPDEMWPVREDLVEPVYYRDNKTGLPDAWSYSSCSRVITYPAHAVAHLYDPDPYNPLRGVGPLQAAHRRANVSWKAEAFDDALVSNGGQIGGILTAKESNLTPKQQEQLARSWAENAENPINHRKTAVLPGGLTFDPAAFSPIDMDFANLRQWSRDEVMMAFGVTKPLLGITEDVNLANAHEARRVFYESTVQPQVEFWADEWGQFIRKLPTQFHDIEANWQIGRIPAMRENTDAQLDRIMKLMQMGRSFREAAEIIGWDLDLDELNGIDDRYVPTTMSAIADDEEGDEKTAAPAMSLNGAQVKSLMDITLQVAMGALPKSTAIQMIVTAFPINEARARAIVNPIKEGSIAPATVAAPKSKALNPVPKFTEFVEPFEKRGAKRLEKVFRNYVVATRKRIENVAGGKSVSVRPWTYDRIHRDYYGGAERVTIDVKGISRDELNALIVANNAKWEAELWGAIEPVLEDVLGASAKRTAMRIGSTAFPVATNPSIIAHMEATEVLVKGTLETFQDQIKNAILRGMTDSGTGTLADRIRESIDEIRGEMNSMMERAGTRAELISRTEVPSAANAAAEEQMIEDGIEEREWMSSGGPEVRLTPSSHRIDGEKRKIGKRFSNGLLRPGDKTNPHGVGAIANCRCEAIPVIPND